MAANLDFTPGYAHTLAQLQIDQQVDPMALAVAVLAAAKAFAPLGMRAGGALLKKMFGGNNKDVEELMRQVDWKRSRRKQRTSLPSAALQVQPSCPRT